ncbi:hypothetical protein BN946_scf185013.g66, partial [Trametes cinnabarina]
MPDLLGALLRNDSVMDWIARIDVYRAMLALLKRMAECKLTLEQVLVGPRWEMSRSCGLEEWMWGDGDIVWEKDVKPGDFVPAPPLYVHFKKLTKQTLVKATSLCGDIIAAKDDIERAMAVVGKSLATAADIDHESSVSYGASGKGKTRAVDMDTIFTTECTGLDYRDYYYSRSNSQSANATRNPRIVCT